MQMIILAAGKGSRMNSELPKVMHKVNGKPMLESVMQHCWGATEDIVLVYSEHLEPYLKQFSNRCTLAHQKEQLGTAHAVYVAKDMFNDSVPIGVIYGDNPLITSEIITDSFAHLKQENAAVATLAFEYDKPNAYGRIVTDKDGNFLKIIESKFANEEQKKITLCNSGVMVFAPGILNKYIEECLVKDQENPEKELYLTDIIRVCVNAGEKVTYYKVENHKLVIGVNTQAELKALNKDQA